MNIVQSGLSASIRALESELGASLFLRTTRRVELTVAGRVLYEKALNLLAGAHEAKLAVAAISGLERGSLSIGTCSSLNAFFDLSLLLGEFHAQHPGIEIELFHSNAAALMEKVKGEIVVTDRGMVTVAEGSSRTSWGSSSRPQAHTLRPLRSLSTQVRVTSEPVPDVVGIAITGGPTGRALAPSA